MNKYIKLNLVVFAIFIIGVSWIVSNNAYASEHKISVVGSFNGEFDLVQLQTDGRYLIENDRMNLSMLGSFEYSGYDYANDLCDKIIGDLVLSDDDTAIVLEFTGKKCQYGFMSFVIGTVDMKGVAGKNNGMEGTGKLTFYTDHHTDLVFGQLRGSLR